MADADEKGKGGGEDMAFESSAFEALERDFQEVLQEPNVRVIQRNSYRTI